MSTVTTRPRSISPGANVGCATGLWALTSYFNPMGYERRLRAYRVFRESLGVPLITVELGHEGRFDLETADADILLQVPGQDVMWQKERLLNLALGRLPGGCDKVLWLDCDVLFERDDWPARVAQALSAYPLMQIFERVHYLGADWKPGDRFAGHVSRVRPSLAAGVAAGLPVSACLVHPSPAQRPGTYAHGMAWAARRELLERHGFFDASIIGGGDRAISCAAYGCFEHVFAWHELNDRQRAYYLRWAEPFRDDCRGRVGVLHGDIYHQWHGKVSDRGLGSRHGGLRRFGFDPFNDIALDAHGCWRWNSAKPELHAYVRDYFASRREDG